MPRPGEFGGAEAVPLQLRVPEQSPNAPLKVAVLYWQTDDGISSMLCEEMAQLGHNPLPFRFGSPMPAGVHVLFSFGPYGPLMPVWEASANRGHGAQPVVVHWNTEGMPDLRLPSVIMRMISQTMSHATRRGEAAISLAAVVRRSRAWASWKDRTARFRYTGDYLYAYRRGWLHILADTSAIYSEYRCRLGIPAIYAPWGAAQRWHADLQLKRDIEVLWMGTRGTARRSLLLDQVFTALRAHHVNMYVADNIERPFIYGKARTELLNRCKITLNITRTWYDDNFSRFAMAIPNRSLVISEPMLPHCRKHYVAAPADQIADTILSYLRHEERRQLIVDQAYQFITTELAFRKSVGRMLDLAAQRIQQRAGTGSRPA
jgi:hypothetical protein